jgi:nucleoside-diphosphate-sugar epimerase
MPTALVTGAAGFIGSFLCEELLRRGYQVVGVDNLFRGRMANLSDAQKSAAFEFRRLDLTERDAARSLNELLRSHSATVVYHYAAVNGTQHFYDHPTLVLDTNTRATIAVMEALEGTLVERIVYASSSEVYGEPEIIPTPESHHVKLTTMANRDSYAASKAIGDYYTRLFAQELGIGYVILRIFNTYGERMVNTKYGQVIPEFIRKCSEQAEFEIIGDGSNTRSFCYVQDAVERMVGLGEKGDQPIYNVGNDEELSILELAKLVHEQMGRPFRAVFLPERPNEHKRRCPDISLMRATLGNLRVTSLKDGLKRTIAYYEALKTQPSRE